MKNRVFFLTFLITLLALTAFQNCSGESFDELPVIGEPGRNTGNRYQGANNPNYYVFHETSPCADPARKRDTLRWAGQQSWEVIRRECADIAPAEPVDDARILVSDLNLQIAVVDDQIFSIWQEVPMQGFCAAVRADRSIDKNEPLFALTYIDGVPQANVLFNPDGGPYVRGIYELPVTITGADYTVRNGDIQMDVHEVHRRGQATLSVRLPIPDTNPVQYFERTNLPVTCHSNAGVFAE